MFSLVAFAIIGVFVLVVLFSAWLCRTISIAVGAGRVAARIAAIFGISHADFESLKAPHFKNIDPSWAYKTLEIEPTATDDEVKKAYRRMAMKYHPDKVHELGEDIKKSATEKFRSVNEAYESIKKTRNIA
jgi:DnaJ like chaperone protein